jgi:organic hydroperoxide reductase OsmC/OhrA
MQPLPHHYLIRASLRTDGGASISADGLPAMESAPPAEFGGPGNRWSPEALLTAAVADCFVLNFGVIAAASKFSWVALEAQTKGTLERVDGKLKFTRFDTDAKLTLPAGANSERAGVLLEKAEASCPIANSLNCERHLTTQIGYS